MQSRRSLTKQVQDYQNPKKSNQFSPSPIRRYQNQRSFNLSQQASSTDAQQQILNDNKENVSFTKKAQQLSTKRSKKPLQEVKRREGNVHSATVGKDLLIGAGDLELTKKSKSQKHVPLDLAEAANDNNQQQILNRELNTSMEENQHQRGVTKKRMEKLDRKKATDIETLEEYKESDQGHIEPSEVRGVLQSTDIQQNSRKDQLSQLTKKIDNQSDSLMEGTYHSAHSGTNPGMQYQGRWTQEEHDKFLEGLKVFGKDWRQIEDHIGSRSCAQIRSHAQKYFNKLNRDQQKLAAKHEKSILGKRKREETKKETEDQFSIQMSRQIPLTPLSQFSNVQQHHQFNEQQQQYQHPQSQQLHQIQPNTQIHETLLKLAEDDTFITLKNLIAQREQVCLEFITKKESSEETCKRLIMITNAFHQSAMKALQSCKFEICNRMIDERNLTQFICILLSKQVTVVPDPTHSQEEIIQHVHTVSSQQSVDSLQIPLSGAGGFHKVTPFKSAFEAHDGETAKSSPQINLKSHGKSGIHEKSTEEALNSEIKINQRQVE